MLALAVTLFLLAFLLSYPLTLRLDYAESRLRLFWLPRLCGGYAAPRALRLTGRTGPGRRQKKKSRQKPRVSLPAAKDILFYGLGRVSVDQLSWRCEIGIGSPFATSLLTGAVYAALGSIGGVVAAAVRHFPARPDLQVQANWSGGGIKNRCQCIFHLHCGDIIGILCYALVRIGKGRLTNDKRA